MIGLDPKSRILSSSESYLLTQTDSLSWLTTVDFG